MPTLTVTIVEDMNDGLNELAREFERTRESLIADAIERFVQEELDFVRAIREGDEDFAAGRFVTHEELVAQLRATRESKRAA